MMWDFEQVQGVIQYVYTLLVDLIQSCINCILHLFRKKQIIKFEDGFCVRIIIGNQIGEGGFSVVFEARDDKPFKFLIRSSSSSVRNRNKKRYALKRIMCNDKETIMKCEKECEIHRRFKHPNLLPLLATKIDQQSENLNVCYMLFPYLSSSLRDEIKGRGLIQDSNIPSSHRIVVPFKERELLEIFSGCVDAVSAMHEKGYSHNDIKVENVMFGSSGSPILIDYGSVGPLNVKLRTRSDVLHIVDDASTNTTIPYRAPELFEGGAQYGEDEPDIDGRIDVWSLGCLLFAMMYGTSPFECEFRNAGGSVKVVDCTHLRIIGRVPRPEPHSVLANRYDPKIFDFVEYMLTQDRIARPTIQQVSSKLDELLQNVGGTWPWRIEGELV